ncbi:hypothetical protein Syun_022713 [Stephania yunnanensis]|uniref:Uncharacterized protein n=1 Tax=Stephania yunnanensis TaxID=152371 RepID=A0AAP0FA68_9MAGN
MGGTTIYVTALDNIVSVNSLYAFAVFVGLSWNPIDSRNTTNTLTSNPTCAPPLRLAENVIAFQVYSFSSFRFSTLLALSLKQAIRISTTFQMNLMAILSFASSGRQEVERIERKQRDFE